MNDEVSEQLGIGWRNLFFRPAVYGLPRYSRQVVLSFSNVQVVDKLMTVRLV